MHKDMTHIDDYFPRQFCMLLLEFSRKHICSFTYDFDILYDSEVGSLIFYEFIESHISRKLLSIVYRLKYISSSRPLSLAGSLIYQNLIAVNGFLSKWF